MFLKFNFILFDSDRFIYFLTKEIFDIAKEKLKHKIDSWGYMPSKLDYYKVLSKSDIVLSTSIHEFFGVAM